MTLEALLNYIRTCENYEHAMRQLQLFVYNERSNAYSAGYNDGYLDGQERDDYDM